jgi:galactonate dehydratase
MTNIDGDVRGSMSELGLIKKIETIRWKSQPNLLWVVVHTGSGVTGLGETYYLPSAVEAVIHDFAAGLLLDRPASRIVGHWEDLFACVNFSGFAGAELRAVSALDMALWDAFGKSVDRPVYELLGGAYRPRIPVYNTCVSAGRHPDGDRFLSDPANLAEELIAEGFHGMKVWPWDRYAPQITSITSTGPAGWSAMGPVGHYLSAHDLTEGLGVLERIRERVGNRIEIILEGHSRWDVNSALRIARAVQPFDPLWMEDFIQPDSPDDLGRIGKETTVPQAVSERLMSRFPFREVLQSGAAHVIMLDVAWTGGITESRRIADLAGAYHLPMSPHDCTGPVTAFANLHIATAVPNAMITEAVRGFVDGYYQDVLDQALPIKDGYGTPPEGAGLGASLRDDFRDRQGVTIRTSTAAAL